MAYRIFFLKYPLIFFRYILYIRKIKLPIYPWLLIFSSLILSTCYGWEDLTKFNNNCCTRSSIETEESIDHFFFFNTKRLWHKLFRLARLNWVYLKHKWHIDYFLRGLESPTRGTILWQIVCLTLIWIISKGVAIGIY